MRPTASDLATVLGLQPHPEGGFFRETYRAEETVLTSRGERPTCTATLFLVTAASVSRLHRLASDELWVFQGGRPLELVVLSSGAACEVHVLGAHDDEGLSVRLEDAAAAQVAGLLPQALVPAGSWQGARLAGGAQVDVPRAWALCSCIVSPGFDYADFEMGEREALLAAFPEHAATVRALT